MSSAARILLGGTGSGCGKTTVTSAVLRALQRRRQVLRAFKCGPDYIDPMFHTAVLGVPSRNLDLFFVSGRQVRADLARCIPAGGMGVIEGAMGFYDGVSGVTDVASAAHLARTTGTPAVLVVRPKGQSLSLAAELYGFARFAENTLQGVILNGISEGMFPFYKEIVEKAGLKSYGYLPPVPQAEIPDRHLGLVTAAEIDGLHHKLDLLADAAEKGIDLDGLTALARTASPLPCQNSRLTPACTEPVRIAVAHDRAFCFYYADNLDVLNELGAELTRFSPLEDQALPQGIQGLYLGGGYPELYAEQLSANTSMRESVRQAVCGGLPTIAECGGFLYLHRALASKPMAGALPVEGELTERLQNFGYVTLTAQHDSMLGRTGDSIRAHEFHYVSSSNAGNAFRAEKPNGRSWQCVHASQTLYAGYPHLYFRSNPAFAARFVRKCASMR